MSAPESPYLAFIVGLHVATALALLVFFWRDWVRIVGGFVSSVRYRRMRTDSERLAWLIILATIPIGLAGLLLEHTFRTVLGPADPGGGVPDRQRTDFVGGGAASAQDAYAGSSHRRVTA